MALASGAWRRSLARLTAWQLLASGCLFFGLGAAVNLYYDLTKDGLPLVSAADAAWVAAYLLFGAGLLVLQHPNCGRDLGAVVDGAIIGFATLTVTWLLIIDPSLASGRGETLARFINTLYPVIDITLITLVVRLRFARTHPSVPVLGMAAGLALILVSDLGYLVNTEAAVPHYSRWLDVSWALGLSALCLATLLLARSATAAVPVPSESDAAARVGPVRLLALAVALAVPPVLAVDLGWSEGDRTLLLLGLAGLVLVGLGSVRLIMLVHVVRRQLDDAMALQAHLAHQATHDSVTGLPNREQFAAELARALAKRSAGASTGVLFVDLDQFKAVNDTLGHDAGDLLLKAVAGRIAGVLRGGDVLARFGGDEFVVLLEDVASEDEAVGVARRVAAAVRTPSAVPSARETGPNGSETSGWADVERVVITATIGVAVTADPDACAADVLRDADAALLEGKQRGRDVVVVFADSMRDHLARWLVMEHDLRKAVDEGHLRLTYQPEIDVTTSSLFGVEALLRWDHPEIGLVPPSAFLSVAESSGLIAPIGRWVIEEACRQARTWRDRFGEHAPVISVNISPTHLAREDVSAHVERNLRRHDLPAQALRVEVTETALLGDHPHVSAQIQQLHDLGVEVAVDDFGTGFFSLRNLKGLAADLIKIDRSFVSGVGTDRTDDAVIHAVIDLSRRLGVRTIAEGVETGEQTDLLVAAGCDVVQGYLYAKPMSAEALEACIADGTISLEAAGPVGGTDPGLRLVE